MQTSYNIKLNIDSDTFELSAKELGVSARLAVDEKNAALKAKIQRLTAVQKELAFLSDDYEILKSTTPKDFAYIKEARSLRAKIYTLEKELLVLDDASFAKEIDTSYKNILQEMLTGNVRELFILCEKKGISFERLYASIVKKVANEKEKK